MMTTTKLTPGRIFENYDELLSKHEVFIKPSPKTILGIKDAINCYMTLHNYPDAFYQSIKNVEITNMQTIHQLSARWVLNEFPNAYGLDLKPRMGILKWILENIDKL